MMLSGQGPVAGLDDGQYRGLVNVLGKVEGGADRGVAFEGRADPLGPSSLLFRDDRSSHVGEQP